jgi:hypothetical protein
MSVLVRVIFISAGNSMISGSGVERATAMANVIDAADADDRGISRRNATGRAVRSRIAVAAAR